ncbi:MAG: DUF5107 domain-containing protein, partial [bacterium]
MFAHDSKEDFFAGYDHGKQAGVVHVGDHHQVPGKKFWTWGTGTRGKRWEKIYTDKDGPYLELMVGAFSDNQPDYSWIQPYEVKVAKMNWFPLREVGGVKNANLEAAVNLELVSEDTARLGFNTTREHQDAIVRLTCRGMEVLRRSVQIGPASPFVETVKLPSKTQGDEIRAMLYSSGGELLIDYQSAPHSIEPMPKAVKAPSNPEKAESEENLYFTGLRLEQFHNPSLDPEPFYQEALRRDPLNSRVNTILGIQSCKRGDFDQAVRYLQAAVERAGKDYTRLRDAEPLYYLGIALRALGQESESVDAFSRASWDLSFRSPARYQLAELFCRQGRFDVALSHLEASLAVNCSNLQALTLKVVVLRRLGRRNEAWELASRLASEEPLSFWVRNELALLNPTGADQVLRDLAGLMRGEDQSYLELAVSYGNSGLWEEAIGVLERALDRSKEDSTQNPMIYYYLAYYALQTEDSGRSSEFLRRANQHSPELCFPFRLESISVLRKAIEISPEDAVAPYLLGNLLYDLQPKQAILAWERARTL